VCLLFATISDDASPWVFPLGRERRKRNRVGSRTIIEGDFKKKREKEKEKKEKEKTMKRQRKGK